jgi:hypothetical protein
MLIAQNKKMNYEAELSTHISSKNNLPFWMVTNKYGIVPDENSGVLQMGIFTEFNKKENFDSSFGVSLAGNVDDNIDAFIDQAYGSFRYKSIQLDIGVKHEDIRFDGISSTNGNVFNSSNSRSIPKLKIGFHRFVPVPYFEDWLAIKGMYSEGIMIDDRYVDNTRLHHKNFYLKIGGERKLNLIVGFQHYAMWAGTSSNPEYGKLPSDFKNYLRVVQAKEGTDEKLYFEWENSVGNHLGGWDLKLTYKTRDVDLELYRQTMLEDHSGIYITRPDGVTGLFARFHGDKRWVQSIIYENYYTKYQSGSTPGGSPKPDGGLFTGQDNYFNNGIYRSGWTYYERTIGIPFFYPDINDKGIAMGVYNNRIVGHHIGAKGYLFHKVLYKTMISYTQNWGTYSNKFENGMKEQLSGLFEIKLPMRKLPFDIGFALAIDKGEMLKDNVGCFFKLSKSGVFN